LKAIVLSETGGPDTLVYTEVPDPEPADGAQVMRVRAAGINFMDILIRRGDYPQPPPLPAIPGAEVAGELEDGRRAIGFTRNSSGGYAEQALVEDAWLVELPENASFAEGASFLMTFLTAWIPMQWQVSVRPGSTVLVHAGAGGVGSAALQLAKLLGARVLATASEHKRDVVRQLGAEPVPYEGFAEIVREGTDGRGVDLVFDAVGGDVFEQSIGALAPLGTIVALGYAGGMWPQVNPALLVGRNIGVQGLYLGRLMRLQPQLVQSAAQDLIALWEAGDVKPLVGAELDLADAPEAHRLVENRLSHGKVVLIP
jgi:NADPH2:quinone reductase